MKDHINYGETDREFRTYSLEDSQALAAHTAVKFTWRGGKTFGREESKIMEVEMFWDMQQRKDIEEDLTDYV
jgi:hypothetical protein